MSLEQPDLSSEYPCIDLRIQAKYNTVNWEVFLYLMRNPIWNPKQGRAMLSQSVQDYWLAYARQSSDSALAKTTALACIGRMEYQIAKLRHDFQIARSPTQSPHSQVDLEATHLAISELLSEVKRIPLSLDAISTALINGGITLNSTVLSNPPIESRALEAEPKSFDGKEALEEFLKENGSLINNLAENLDFG